MTWYDPRVWQSGENLTATKLNEQLSGNMNYLFQRPRSIVTVRDGTDISLVAQSTGVFVEVDDSVFTLEIETFGGDVRLFANFSVFVTGASSRHLIFDWLIDDTDYVSSLTPSALNKGVWDNTIASAQYEMVELDIIVEGLEAGVHTFKLRHSCDYAASIISAEAVIQVGAMEI